MTGTPISRSSFLHSSLCSDVTCRVWSRQLQQGMWLIWYTKQGHDNIKRAFIMFGKHGYTNTTEEQHTRVSCCCWGNN
jgi:hypothetical protein